MKNDFEIGEIVAIKNTRHKPRKKAIILNIEDDRLFCNERHVKIIYLGACNPTFTLSDRIVKL